MRIIGLSACQIGTISIHLCAPRFCKATPESLSLYSYFKILPSPLLNINTNRYLRANRCLQSLRQEIYPQAVSMLRPADSCLGTQSVLPCSDFVSGFSLTARLTRWVMACLNVRGKIQPNIILDWKVSACTLVLGDHTSDSRCIRREDSKIPPMNVDSSQRQELSPLEASRQCAWQCASPTVPTSFFLAFYNGWLSARVT
jgi:hypothetical protein